MHREGERMIPVPVPEELREALKPYSHISPVPNTGQ
jgi:hypothetical protein